MPASGYCYRVHGKPQRLRVNGEAWVNDQDPLLDQMVGARLLVRVTARGIFPNCPRYIPTMQLAEPSIYAPRAGCDAPEPACRALAPIDIQRLIARKGLPKLPGRPAPRHWLRKAVFLISREIRGSQLRMSGSNMNGYRR
jgi:hypothetical protein